MFLSILSKPQSNIFAKRNGQNAAVKPLERRPARRRQSFLICNSWGTLLRDMPCAEIKQTICSLILATDNTFHHSLLRDLKEIDCTKPQRIFREEEKEVRVS